MEDDSLDAWIDEARCRKENTELFFILRGDPEQRKKRTEAYAICQFCPVKLECLDYAIINHEVGIWGGTTDAERRFLRRSWTPKSEPRKRIVFQAPVKGVIGGVPKSGHLRTDNEP
jgi:WhiB family redox-sensing transcriptional regulator